MCDGWALNREALTIENRLMMMSACLRSVRKALQQRFLYILNVSLSCEHK